MSNRKKKQQGKPNLGDSSPPTESFAGNPDDSASQELVCGDVPATPRKIDLKTYEQQLRQLQIELVKLQEWVRIKGKRVVVIFEGRDAAGKGGVIKRIAERLNPRICRIVALGKPNERQLGQWYFQRYVEKLPSSGEIVLMDRSWYNRAGVERVMQFCTDEQYHEFLVSCPDFERLLVRSGLILVKYWFSISAQEQERRFQKRLKDPTKHWKLSDMDLASRSRWNQYSECKDIMMQHTDTQHAPWYIVEADSKRRARLNCIKHLLSVIDFKEIKPTPRDGLSPRPAELPISRTPKIERNYVPEVF